MAIVKSDLLKEFSSETAKEVREKSLGYAVFDTTWSQDWEDGAETVQIPIPDFAPNDTPDPDEGVEINDRARGGNWGTPREPNQDTALLTRSGGLEGSNRWKWEDVVESVWDMVERYRSRQTYALRKAADDKILDYAMAAPSQTITVGTDGSWFVDRAAPLRCYHSYGWQRAPADGCYRRDCAVGLPE